MDNHKAFFLVFVISFLTISSITFVQAEYEEDLKRGLVVYFSLNESSGTNVPNTAIGATIDGTTYNMEDGDWMSAKINNGLNFSQDGGTHEYVDGVGLGMNISGNISFCTWIKLYGSTFGGVFIDWVGGDQNYFMDYNAGIFRIGNGQESLQTLLSSDGKVMPDGNWIYTCYTRDVDSNNLSLWFNGKINVSVSSSRNGYATNNADLRYGTWGDSMEATLDEFGFWNRTLNQSEIQTLYNSGSGYYPITAGCSPSVVNTTWTDWINTSESCFLNDTFNQDRNLTEWDENECGGANVTYFDYQDLPCNNCSYNLVNTSWTEWINETNTCYTNNTYIQNRSLIEYDSNYTTCFLLTSLPTDEWTNLTFWETRTPSCSIYTGLGNPDNTFNDTFTFIIGGAGAIISLLLIIGTFYMLHNGSMPFQTFIKCIMIETIMFLIAGTILLI